RMDDQVKLRGLRVELGEIEGVMNSFPGVRTSVCVVVHGETDYLAAYFTAERKVDPAELRAHLSSYLTAYMVPQALMQLDEMPLTANGKVDKKALPEAQVMVEELEQPQNETQERMLDIVRTVIGVDEVGVSTDLFTIGLSSIGCIRLCAMLDDEFGETFKVADVFERRTVKELEKLLSQDAEAEGEPRAEAGEPRDTYPLSQTQAGIFVECLRFPETTAYNIPLLYRLDAGVDLERLADALRRTLEAHPYLFMTVRRGADGEILAVRNEPVAPEIPIRTELPAAGELVRPFDVPAGERLFRAELFDAPEGKHLFLDTHHIVSDGESLDILLDDLERAYRGEELEAEAYTGFDYALDEERSRASERLDVARAFYDGVFRGCGGDTVPLADGVQTDEHIAFARVEADVADEVRSFCAESGVTPNAFFTTAFGLALQSYTAAEDGAVFATIYNGRSDSRLEHSVSMLVKTLPVLFADDPALTVRDAVASCQGYLLGAMANDIYSFAEISGAYGIKGDILFAYQGDSDDVTLIGGAPAEEIDLELSQAKAGMDIDVYMKGDKVVFDCSYDPARYGEGTVRGLLGVARVVCHEFTTRATLGDVTLVTEGDERRIRELHDTDWPVAERPAYRLVQDQAAAHPDHVALVACDRTLTYGELNAQANA
ncbi:MAG: hypothetical protein J6D54_04500, partial [Olsenella sp.]|nr:hypothetical protein [Olsenella sp.]